MPLTTFLILSQQANPGLLRRCYEEHTAANLSQVSLQHWQWWAPANHCPQKVHSTGLPLWGMQGCEVSGMGQKASTCVDIGHFWHRDILLEYFLAFLQLYCLGFGGYNYKAISFKLCIMMETITRKQLHKSEWPRPAWKVTGLWESQGACPYSLTILIQFEWNWLCSWCSCQSCWWKSCVFLCLWWLFKGLKLV